MRKKRHPDRPSKARRALRWLRRTALLAVLLVTVAPWRGYWFDFVAVLAPQLSIVLLALGVAIGALRWRVGIEFAMVGASLLFYAWLLSDAGSRPQPGGATAQPLRLVLYNCQGENSRGDDEFFSWFLEQSADLVCLIDPPASYLRAEPQLTELYPYRVEPQPGRWWGIVLLSKHPFESTPLAETTDETRSSFIIRRSVTVTLPDGQRFLFSGTHPPSPRSAQLWRSAHAQAARDGAYLNRYREDAGLPVLIAGDFNSAPTGRGHQIFARESGLVAWAPLLGAGTWPSALPPIAAIPIDRVWMSPDISVDGFKIGPRFKSDHRPVVLDLRLFGRSSTPETTQGGAP